MNKIPSELEVALLYKLLTLLTMFTLFTLLILFKLLKLILKHCTVKTRIVEECQNAIEMGLWASDQNVG